MEEGAATSLVVDERGGGFISRKGVNMMGQTYACVDAVLALEESSMSAIWPGRSAGQSLTPLIQALSEDRTHVMNNG
jgi:hypothetical protein